MAETAQQTQQPAPQTQAPAPAPQQPAPGFPVPLTMNMNRRVSLLAEGLSGGKPEARYQHYVLARTGSETPGFFARAAALKGWAFNGADVLRLEEETRAALLASVRHAETMAKWAENNKNNRDLADAAARLADKFAPLPPPAPENK